jgi:hypothetical protein
LDETVRKKIDDNSATIEIFTNNKLFFSSDNLSTKHARETYVNNGKSWSRYYDSNIVYVIKGQYPMGQYPSCQGLLSIDSLNGKLDNDTCRLYAEELSLRLAIMLYRLERTKDRLERAKAVLHSMRESGANK